jgi:DNA-directed RNA polymerase subunit RPC12/RpoP
VKAVCPKCKAEFPVIDRTKIESRVRNTVECPKCKSRFYVQEQEKVIKGAEQVTQMTLLHCYFEKRKNEDRRKGKDRRREIKAEDLNFKVPSSDFIPIFDENGKAIGYTGPGKRKNKDRRKGKDRRHSIRKERPVIK